MSSKQTQPNLARIGVVTIVGGGLMFAAAQILAKPKEQPVVKAVSRSGSTTSTGAAAANETAPVVSVRSGLPAPERPALAGEPPIRNLFSPLVKPPSEKSSLFEKEKAKPIKPAPVVKPAAPVKTEPVKPAVVDAASTVEMMGVVELDDKVQAILKNRASGERLFVSKGEEAFGYKVGEIKATSVELTKAGGGPGSAEAKPEMVEMSSLTIVEGAASAPAAAVGSGPGVGTPGGPGGPGSPGGRPGFGPGNNGGRGDRSSRGSRGGGDMGSGGGEGGFTTASLFSLPTWTERLKKLEEVKGQMTTERYDRLKKFMTDRAAAEKK